MTDRQKKILRTRFFRELGPNAEAFRALFDAAPQLCFYMKDAAGRIMALNRRNCDVCNIRDEWDAIGLTSKDIFASDYAEDYMKLDREVLATGLPVLRRVTYYPADRSKSVMVSDVYPLRNAAGKLIGTARAYTLATDDNANDKRDARLKAVIDFVEGHYAEPLRLNQLIECSGLSRNTFLKSFAEVFGLTPWRYLMTVRLNAARRMLEETSRPISEIAAETGFCDQSHLTHAFRKERGMTPGEYVRLHKTPKGAGA